jgi:hypothetical protein
MQKNFIILLFIIATSAQSVLFKPIPKEESGGEAFLSAKSISGKVVNGLIRNVQCQKLERDERGKLRDVKRFTYFDDTIFRVSYNFRNLLDDKIIEEKAMFGSDNLEDGDPCDILPIKLGGWEKIEAQLVMEVISYKPGYWDNKECIQAVYKLVYPGDEEKSYGSIMLTGRSSEDQEAAMAPVVVSDKDKINDKDLDFFQNEKLLQSKDKNQQKSDNGDEQEEFDGIQLVESEIIQLQKPDKKNLDVAPISLFKPITKEEIDDDAAVEKDPLKFQVLRTKEFYESDLTKEEQENLRASIVEIKSRITDVLKKPFAQKLYKFSSDIDRFLATNGDLSLLKSLEEYKDLHTSIVEIKNKVTDVLKKELAEKPFTQKLLEFSFDIDHFLATNENQSLLRSVEEQIFCTYAKIKNFIEYRNVNEYKTFTEFNSALNEVFSYVPSRPLTRDILKLEQK